MVVGTKAQFIKMVPIILELERRGWPCRVIDTGQHAALIRRVVQDLQVGGASVSLCPRTSGVSTLIGGLRWMLQLLRLILRRRRHLAHQIFGAERGVCVVHGDTMSTLLATILAKRGGQRVAHVEAGLRSWNYCNPFPEELIRVIVMRLADYLFAPSAAALANLTTMGLAHKAYRTPGNTNLDTVALALRRQPTLPDLPAQYAVASVHRLETLYQKRRLALVVRFLLAAHQRLPLVFVQHPPTLARLRAHGFEQKITQAGVKAVPLLGHTEFLHLLKGAQFVLTDGGSVQEEASYLGVPCLLLRRKTEREDGIGDNVVLSELKECRVQEFLAHFDALRRHAIVALGESPSAVIASALASMDDEELVIAPERT